MKVKDFIEHVNKYNNYEVLSDSGWECDPTDIEGAYISENKKIIIITQSWEVKYGTNIDKYNRDYETDDFRILYNYYD
jgi:hypothetical protein